MNANLAMAIGNLKNITGDTVDNRSEALIKEFENHAKLCMKQNSSITAANKDSICCGWLIQKVASLQLIVEAQQDIINGLIKNIN